MNRFKNYDVSLIEYSVFNELIYKGKVVAKVDKKGKVIYIYHNTLLISKEGREIMILLKKGKIDQY